MKYSIDYLELRQLNFITLINFSMKSKLATYANFSEFSITLLLFVISMLFYISANNV